MDVKLRLHEFLILGEALAAYERAAQDELVPILICDEFDKVSEKLEDMLLQLFARGYAHVPRFGKIGVRDQARWPVVILLSNNHRHDLSSPMRSRCLYSWLNSPTPREEVHILSARCPQASSLMLIKTAKMISAIRGLPGIVDKPGIRESITLLRTLVREGKTDLTIEKIENHLCFLAKRRLDLENLRKSLARIEMMMEMPDAEIESWIDALEEVSVNEAITRRSPPNVEALLDRFVERGLLPPETRKHQLKGVLESEHAVIYLRYRIEPLAVEIVSLGREQQDGPAIIGRIATGEDENASPSLFIARQTSNATIPEPFATATQIAAMNWSVEPLRDRTFTPQELEQINDWLRIQNLGK